jgi:hypothetical protein
MKAAEHLAGADRAELGRLDVAAVGRVFFQPENECGRRERGRPRERGHGSYITPIRVPPRSAATQAKCRFSSRKRSGPDGAPSPEGYVVENKSVEVSSRFVCPRKHKLTIVGGNMHLLEAMAC